jgi:hypothetical protein
MVYKAMSQVTPPRMRELSLAPTLICLELAEVTWRIALVYILSCQNIYLSLLLYITFSMFLLRVRDQFSHQYEAGYTVSYRKKQMSYCTPL